jgi:hypothetical protein
MKRKQIRQRKKTKNHTTISNMKQQRTTPKKLKKSPRSRSSNMKQAHNMKQAPTNKATTSERKEKPPTNKATPL